MTIKTLRSLSKILTDLTNNESVTLTVDPDMIVGHSKEDKDLFFENFLDALKVNVSIKSLEFSNTLKNFPVKQLGEILARHNTLERLHLSDNILTSDILMSMATILFNSKSVHTLDIPPMYHGIMSTNLALNLFFEALAKNNRIAILSIAYSPFTRNREIALLQQALQTNTSIIIIEGPGTYDLGLSSLERNINLFKQNLLALTQDDSLLTIDQLLTLKNQVLAVKYHTEQNISEAFYNLEFKTNYSLFNTSRRLIAKKIDDTHLIVHDVVNLIAEYANYSRDNFNSSTNTSQLLSSIEAKINECIYERSSQHINGPSSCPSF